MNDQNLTKLHHIIIINPCASTAGHRSPLVPPPPLSICLCPVRLVFNCCRLSSARHYLCLAHVDL